MIKRNASDLVRKIESIKQGTEECLKEYLDEYAEYGMDNIANELIGIAANLEVVRCELKYAMVRKEGQWI